ncbi:hypothetical protein HK102_004874, partial [Quaeritorhiza haematococci]
MEGLTTTSTTSSANVLSQLSSLMDQAAYPAPRQDSVSPAIPPEFRVATSLSASDNVARYSSDVATTSPAFSFQHHPTSTHATPTTVVDAFASSNAAFQGAPTTSTYAALSIPSIASVATSPVEPPAVPVMMPPQQGSTSPQPDAMNSSDLSSHDYQYQVGPIRRCQPQRGRPRSENSKRRRKKTAAKSGDQQQTATSSDGAQSDGPSNSNAGNDGNSSSTSESSVPTTTSAAT